MLWRNKIDRYRRVHFCIRINMNRFLCLLPLVAGFWLRTEAAEGVIRTDDGLEFEPGNRRTGGAITLDGRSLPSPLARRFFRVSDRAANSPLVLSNARRRRPLTASDCGRPRADAPLLDGDAGQSRQLPPGRRRAEFAFARRPLHRPQAGAAGGRRPFSSGFWPSGDFALRRRGARTPGNPRSSRRCGYRRVRAG